MTLLVQTNDVEPAARLLPQDLLVTLLGNELLHGPGQLVWSGGLVSILGEVGFSTSASRAALGRLVQRGVLIRERDGREAYYRLSDRTAARLTEDERRLLAFDTSTETTGTWTLLTYAVGSDRRAERDRLRRRLSFLGYGSTGDATWLAVGDRVADTDAVVRDLGLSADVDVFIGRPALSTDVDALITRAWPHLHALAERYAAFAERWHHGGPDLDPLVARLLLMHEWREFASSDPGLADVYLPWAGVRSAAQSTFHLHWHRLAPAAAADFAQRCRVPIPATTTP